ncbi:MAG: hypothetical protein F4X15_06295 [Gemmatimonadetes bacterium]|nr:hypothetical protein [Gemmatimonadota bacterium]
MRSNSSARSSRGATVAQVLDYCTYLETLPDSEIGTLPTQRSAKDGVERMGDFEEWYGSQRGESLRPVRMVPVGLGLDAIPHRMVSQLADRAIDILLVTFHGYVHDHEMLLARQVRAADDTRTSSAGPPTSSDLNRKATEHGVAAIWQDARESLDHSVRTYYTKSGITCLQRTTTLPDGVRVRGSHCVTIGEAGEIRITFYPGGRRPGLRGVRAAQGCDSIRGREAPERAWDAMGNESVVLPVGGGETRAAMAVAAGVAAPNCSEWESARGEVDPGHAVVGSSRRAVAVRHDGASRRKARRAHSIKPHFPVTACWSSTTQLHRPPGYPMKHPKFNAKKTHSVTVKLARSLRRLGYRIGLPEKEVRR